MILSSKLYKEHGVLKGLSLAVKYVLSSYLSNISKKNKKTFSAKSIYRSYQRKYPILLKNDKNELRCVSCRLCENICPTSCIEISANTNPSAPLTVGPAPDEFKIELTKCIRCNLCVEVCSVDAIELSGNYNFFDDSTKSVWNKNELIKNL